MSGTVHANNQLPNGVPATGAVVFTVNTEGQVIRDPAGNIVFQGPLTVQLVTGEATLTLPASDDDTLEPTGFTYTATEQLKHVAKSDYRSVDFQVTDGATHHLADFASSEEVALDPSYGASLNEALGEIEDIRDLSDSAFASALAASYVGKSITKAAITGSTVAREVIDPNRTASKWREVYDTALFQTTRYDPVRFFGWNADKAAGGGDAAEPAVYMGFEADYWDTATTRTMEWYVGVLRADSSGPLFRPFAFTAARDGNSDLTASVQVDIGDGSHEVVGSNRSVFNVVAGGPSVAAFTPTAIAFSKPVAQTGYMQFVGSATATQMGPLWTDTTAGVPTTRWGLDVYHSDAAIYLWDKVNNRSHVKYTAGASSAAAVTEFASAVSILGVTTHTAAVVQLNSTVASNSHLEFRIDGSTKWYLANFRGDSAHYLWDQTNGRFQTKYTPGASNTAATTEFQSNVKVDGGLNVAQKTPASASAAGTTGDIAADTGFVYVCTATNTWKRVAVATW